MLKSRFKDSNEKMTLPIFEKVLINLQGKRKFDFYFVLD